MASVSTAATQTLNNITTFTDLDCRIISTVTPSGASPANGSTIAQVFVDSGVQNLNGVAYVQRHYDIEPAADPNTATIKITLYYAQAEFTGYNAAVGSSKPQLPASANDSTGIANVRVNQYHGTPSGGNGTANYPTTWAGSGPAHVLIDPADKGVVWNPSELRWEVTFEVTGFSGFFLTAGNNVPLPVSLIAFSAAKAGSRNRISWTTATEGASYSFEVARGGNGSEFEAIGTVRGNDKLSDYTFYDEQPLAGINYYRLKITETGGNSTYSNIAIVRNSTGSGSVTVSPVPADRTLRITSTDATMQGKQLVICDMQGVVVYQATFTSDQSIDISSWAAGIYALRLPSGEVVRIVKK